MLKNQASGGGLQVANHTREERVGRAVSVEIRHIGISNVSLAQLKEAQAIATIVSVQNLYNLTYRAHEDLLAACTSQQIAFTPFFPLAMGQLGKEGGPIATIAQRYHATPAQIALAWLLARSPSMLPIPGTTSVQHVEENIAAASIRLNAEDIIRIENVLPSKQKK